MLTPDTTVNGGLLDLLHVKKKITVENCHIWNGQQLKGYGIFEFRFRNHKIKLRVFRLKMYIHNGCRAIDTVQYMSNLINAPYFLSLFVWSLV
jgi:hypothetical protein